MTKRLPHGWSYKKLNELGFVGRGKSKHRPRNDPSLYGGKYPFIQTGEITAADLYVWEYRQTYNERGLAQSKVWPPNTLCITIAANIAETAILRINACFPDSIVGFVADPQKADVRFVKYEIDTIKLRMQNVARGTTQGNLSLDKLLSFDLPVPPVSVQRKIAGILAGYDDLIANHTQRIRILEEMARSIYREWFVELRAPGVKLRKATPEEKKATGKDVFPVGWELTSATDVMIVNPPLKVAKDVEQPFVPMSALRNDSMLIGSTEYRRGAGGSKFQNRDTLFARITPCLENGKTAFVQLLPTDQAIGVGSTEFIVLRSKTVCPEFVYLLARSEGFRSNAIKSMSGATGRQRVQEECFEKFPIAHPGERVLSSFHDTVGPMFSTIQVLANRNDNLRRTRDFLLPRLVSGEVDVEGLEGATADVLQPDAAEVSK